MKISDKLFGALFILLGAVILFHVQAFPKIPGQPIGPAMLPGLVASVLAICGTALSIRAFRERKGEPWFEHAGGQCGRKQVLAFVSVVLGVCVYVWFAEVIGFLILAPVLLFLWLKAMEVRVAQALIVGVIASLVIWFVFYRVLRVPLPWGVLTRYGF